MSPHLVVTISPHGFGHLAQTAPVINALRARIPGLRLTVRTTLPEPVVAKRIRRPFAYLPEAADFGLVMASAVEVRIEESAQRYAEFHRRWEHRVAGEARRLEALGPDLVLANVPYLTLAGAAEAGIPALGMSSLNWADVYHHYFGSRPGAKRIHEQMLAAYNRAALFLRLEPSMPMESVARRRSVGPVAGIGEDRRDQIDRMLGLPAGARLVLISVGGVEWRLPIERWPRRSRNYFFVEAQWRVHHPHAFDLEALQLDYLDLLCSCDAILGKPGYGTFAEAACNAVPMLYVSRGDWPEEPWLVQWLARCGRVAELTAEQTYSGYLDEALDSVTAMPAGPRVSPGGAVEAADVIASMLAR